MQSRHLICLFLYKLNINVILYIVILDLLETEGTGKNVRVIQV